MADRMSVEDFNKNADKFYQLENPSSKSPEMVKFLDGLSGSMFGRSLSDSLASRKCVSCGKPALHFEDKLSLKEYGISGLCQSCQNTVFNAEDE
jgi:hypothetical protein